MSLYNLTHGFNIACVLIMPMLGRHQNEYPRFRDCFVSDDMEHIIIFTRVGGPNRNTGYGEEELYDDPHYIKTWDWEEDFTYGFYEFSVPEEWLEDFRHIVSDEPEKVSDEYVDYVKDFYPKLAEDGMIDKLFKRENADSPKTEQTE